ncbi:hypothetical protein ACJ73_01836 [Blastomyces percursus]|uniref:Uncharacterized protein n=1 Tax=Blastomyces percursus TaxID=1658174 RepID=A0A1J9R2Z2_9EURO|nr:hypothetical protein ACJ73_01836 [Blastomyces percursus]
MQSLQPGLRAEECIYSSPSVDGSVRRPAAPVPDARNRIPPPHAPQSRSTSTEHGPEGYEPSKNCAIARAFGYFEDSNTNTMALLRNVDLICENYKDLLETPHAVYVGTAQLQLRRVPDRQIFDFLIQYFVNDLNW